MRARTILLSVSLVSLVGLVALAQPKKGKPQEGEGKAHAAEGEKKESESPPPGGGGDDLGPPPPKPTGGERPEARTSPLTPAPDEFPDAGAMPPPVDYDKLLGQIATLRSRVAALTATLFASKLKVIVETDDSEDARISSLSVTVDDGVVYNAATFSADDGRVVYEHGVAPGHHVLGIEVERYDARGREYRTWQAAKFSIVIPEAKRLDAKVVISEDSDMAEDFPSDRDGEYDLRVKMRASVED